MVELKLRGVLPLEELENKSHTHKLTILHLTEVGSTWVAIYVDSNLIYTW